MSRNLPPQGVSDLLCLRKEAAIFFALAIFGQETGASVYTVCDRESSRSSAGSAGPNTDDLTMREEMSRSGDDLSEQPDGSGDHLSERRSAGIP